MNFQNLEYFVIAANEQNITRAAEMLNISQQALSGNISRLEAELGCKLFNRRPDFELTYSGKCFLKMAVQMLDLKSQSDTILSDINGDLRGELKIGVSHTRGQAILPMLLPEFVRKYPGAELSIAEAPTDTLEKSLENGSIDVMIGFMPVSTPAAVMKPLIKDRMVLVIPKTLLESSLGDKAQKICEQYRKSYDISLFKDFPFILLKENERIRTLVNRYFASKKIDPKVIIETQNVQTAYSLASEGMGISIVPEMYLKSKYTVPGCYGSSEQDGVITLPFAGENAFDTIGIGYNRDRYLSNLANEFINMSLEKMKQEF